LPENDLVLAVCLCLMRAFYQMVVNFPFWGRISVPGAFLPWLAISHY